MTDRARRLLRIAQLLLVVAALGLYVGSKLRWVVVDSADGLGLPRTTVLTGGQWSTALVPLAVLLLAATVAVLAVRGAALRVLAVVVALASGTAAYLAVTLLAARDVSVRAAEVAEVPVWSLTGAQREVPGAVTVGVAAAVALVAAVLLLRGATAGGVQRYRAPTAPTAPTSATAAPASASAEASADGEGAPSERALWDQFDDGHDPTATPSNEGR